MAVEEFTVDVDPDSPFVLGLLLLTAVAIVTGTLVAAAFLLPGTVGALISGRALLTIGLTFVGASLTLVAAAPGLGAPVGDPSAGEHRWATHTGDVRTAIEAARRVRSEVDAAVFYPGLSVAALVVGAFLAVPAETRAAVSALQSMVLTGARPVLLVSVLAFVGAAVVLAAGPWGRLRLGGPEATPQFSDRAYVAMLFSGGIAAGIVFWGPAEAVLHYGTVPPFLEATARSDAALVGALQYTLFHWGVSAWSTYLVVGLPVAYAAYNHDAPLRVSSVLVPLLGPDATERVAGRLVDVLAVVATLGGLSTTLGFLSDQFLTGIEYRWDVALGPAAEVLLVAGLSLIVAVSASAGLGRGMRRLASLNGLVFAGLLGAMAVVGPTSFVLETGGAAVAGYVTDFVPMSLYGVAGGGEWLSTWTVFYWAWWLSWAPFVGLFLARVSRGRRIRTVVLATVGATSLATVTWFVLVGASALSLQHSGTVDLLAVLGTAGVSVAGYPLFDALPLGVFLLVGFLLLVVTFFITSADAATHSLAMLVSRRARPSVPLRVLSVTLFGVLATVLLLVGGRGVVRSAAVLTGVPFALVALVALAGLGVAIHRDR